MKTQFRPLELKYLQLSDQNVRCSYSFWNIVGVAICFASTFFTGYIIFLLLRLIAR
jgi:hypothetical protein